MRKQVLDHGYVELVESWGSDARIIEAARMSTDKGFQGWGPTPCGDCDAQGKRWVNTPEGWLGDEKGEAGNRLVTCDNCHGKKEVAGDEKLLAFLYRNAHHTPFEMAGLILEVQAPIFVFREWHRHRTQSYNELSARYTPLPDVNYSPTIERMMLGAGTNKQAQGTGAALSYGPAGAWSDELQEFYKEAERLYQRGLGFGVPKEIARLCIPVGRYSRMRSSANLRNWLGFLTLRMAPNAQWEIRQFANAVGEIVADQFPRTWELFAS